MNITLNSKKATLQAVCLTCLLVVGCSSEPEKPPPVAEFKEGQFVVSAVSSDRGQVIRVRCRKTESHCWYWVRFAVRESTTNTSVFGDDAISVAPLATVSWMRPYELKAYDN